MSYIRASRAAAGINHVIGLIAILALSFACGTPVQAQSGPLYHSSGSVQHLHSDRRSTGRVLGVHRRSCRLDEPHRSERSSLRYVPPEQYDIRGRQAGLCALGSCPS